MIEVEKKFQPTEEQLKSMLEGAEFLGEKEQIDTYYDWSDFRNFKQGIHLRKRNNEYELKVKILNLNKHTMGLYEEIDNELGIIKKLGFDINKSLAQIIEEKMDILCFMKTKRKEYKKGEFVIDIDETDFGYKMMEIELQVEKEKDIFNAEEKIMAFAKKFDFEIKKLPGKVSECLRVKNPVAFKELHKELHK